MKIKDRETAIRIIQELVKLEQMKNNKQYELHEMLEKKYRWKNGLLTNQGWNKILNNTTKSKKQITLEIIRIINT